MATRSYRKGFDKSAAAKLYIDSYYRNLLDKTEERQKRLEDLQNSIQGLSEEEAKAKELALTQAESEHMRLSRHKISVRDFENVRLIGRGAFGEVRVVRKKLWPGEEGPARVYAMKIMNKDFMIQKNQLAHARAERDAMVEHDDPGVVKLYYSFQDSRFLYFVMEYLPGGDMMNLLIKREILSEQETKFYIAELILAVQAIHKRGYIHRDLKPDNILIGHDGHIKLSDFGLCTSGTESHLSSFYQDCVVPKLEKNSRNNESNPPTARTDRSNRPGLARRSSWNRIRKTMSYSTVGTSNYMAPEILLEQGYGPEIDWWSVGVILYECLIGYAPFSCEDTTETCIMILEYETTLNFPDEPKISEEARDLIQNRLLVDQKSRIAFDDMINHPWFKGIDWQNIRNTNAPWVPELNDEMDSQFFDDFDDDNVDYFFGEDYNDDFDEFSSIPLKDWDDKHLPFVGWTFKRFEPKEKPSAISVFGLDASTSYNSDSEDRKDKSPTSAKSKKNKKGIISTGKDSKSYKKK